MLNRLLQATLIAASFVAGATAVAADADAGKTKSAQCAACHGADGVAISAQFPTLAGQYRTYLVQALKQYRDGTRSNAVMASFAQNLTDADIADLAAYYASQSGLKILPNE